MNLVLLFLIFKLKIVKLNSMFYPRNIFSDLKEHLELKQATVLTGMRRTGKTTLVKQLMSISPIRQKIYFDLLLLRLMNS